MESEVSWRMSGLIRRHWLKENPMLCFESEFPCFHKMFPLSESESAVLKGKVREVWEECVVTHS
jgi:hypothetical protein